jgi:ubiquinone/menaquinone biosynthesis C-methylase UbiE
MIKASAPTKTQDAVTARYDRIARFYDILDKPMDLLGVARRRKRLLAKARGKTLEVGVGTGRNLGLYTDGVQLTGIDISTNMLAKARSAARRRDIDATLEVADVQELPYENGSFDTVTATCVFCSVADPVAGLREVARTARADGQILLLEHVRPRNPVLGWLADRLAPVVSRLMGPEINRRTEDNIAAAGLDIVDIRRWGIWREIVARPTAAADSSGAPISGNG